MPIRVQPPEIEIPVDDPFANDLLGRRESIEALTTLLGNIEGPCVMAVDSGWGMGKTTFLRMWAQHLKQHGHHVIEFNAWETDFTGDPFFALWSEVSAQFASQPGLGSRRKLTDLARKLMPLLRSGARGASLGLAVAGQSDAAVTATGVAATLMDFEDGAEASDREGEATDRTPFPESTYAEAKHLLNEFRTTLQDEASSLAVVSSGLPLVVFIDELDRCRPTYAIELLETAKHLFSVDHIVFVLCLDRTQLAHSVKAVYGSEFAADGYLRRFFDIDYRLPTPDRSALLRAAMRSSGLVEHIGTRREYETESWYAAPDFLVEILGLLGLSVRDSLQLMHRLAVIVSSIPPQETVLANAIAVLLALRTVDAELYRRVLAGTVTDTEAVSAVVGDSINRERVFNTTRIFLEGALAACICVATLDDAMRPDLQMVPMLHGYHELDREVAAGNREHNPDSNHAGLVLASVNRLIDPMGGGGKYDLGPIGNNSALQIAMRRLELFPPSVIDSIVG